MKFILHILSLLFYGHGIRLKWPLITGFAMLIISAWIYYVGGQTGDSFPEAIKISAKILISTTQVVNQANNTLTGFCEKWSIVERLLGTILIIAFTVVLARKY